MSVMEVKALEILVSRFQTLYFTKNLPENKKELYDALVVEVAESETLTRIIENPNSLPEDMLLKFYIAAAAAWVECCGGDKSNNFLLPAYHMFENYIPVEYFEEYASFMIDLKSLIVLEMSEGDETSEEDIMAFYNQPIPANSAAKLTAKQISAFSDFLKTHIDTLTIIANDDWRSKNLYNSVKKDALRVLYRVYESKFLSKQTRIPSPLKSSMKSPKSEFINSNSVKQQKSPSISERFASIENSRKNTAKPEKVVHRLNYNVKISTDETTAPKSSLLIQNERTAILHKLGEKVPNTVIKIDATRNYSASHRRQAIAAFREFRPEEQPEFEPLWKSKQSIQNIAFNPFYPVKPKIVQKVRANQGESKLFFQLKYGGGPQPTPVPVESTKSVQFNGVPKKNQALEKIDYDSPRPTGIWNNPIVRYFYPSSP